MLDEEDVFRRAVCWLQRCYDNMGDIVSETLLDQISTVWLSPVQFDKMKDENNLYGNACIAIVENCCSRWKLCIRSRNISRFIQFYLIMNYIVCLKCVKNRSRSVGTLVVSVQYGCQKTLE